MLANRLRAPGEARERLAPSQGQRDLLQQQRVPAAQIPGPPGIRPAQARPADRQELGGRPDPERRQALDLGVAGGGQPEAGLLSGGGPGAERGQQRDADLRQPAREEGDEGERVGIAPVQIVDGDQKRSAAAPLQPAQDPMVGRRRLQHGAGPSAGEPRRAPREAVERPGGEAEGDHRLHRLAAGQSDLEVRLGGADRSLEHGGLAKPSLRHDEEGPPATRAGGVEQGSGGR